MCEQLSVGPLESKMYVPTKLSYSELKELVAAKLESYTIHKILTYSTFYSMYRRCLVGSTDQACSSGFYFKIA